MSNRYQLSNPTAQFKEIILVAVEIFLGERLIFVVFLFVAPSCGSNVRGDIVLLLFHLQVIDELLGVLHVLLHHFPPNFRLAQGLLRWQVKSLPKVGIG